MIKLKIKEIRDGYDIRATYKDYDLGEVCALISDLYDRLEMDFGIERKDITALISEFSECYK